MRKLSTTIWLLSLLATTTCFAQSGEEQFASTVQRLNGYSRMQIDYTFLFDNKYKLYLNKTVDGQVYKLSFVSNEINITSLSGTEIKVYCKNSSEKCIEIEGPRGKTETSNQIVGSRNARSLSKGMNDLLDQFASKGQTNAGFSRDRATTSRQIAPSQSNSPSKAKSIIELEETEGGVYKAPVEINGVLKIHMILDSGASEGSISPDVALTLIRTSTINRNDWLPSATYTFANGQTAESSRFEVDLKVGDQLIENVAVSISNNIEAPLLLGQNTLSQFGSVEIDYNTDRLIIR